MRKLITALVLAAALSPALAAPPTDKSIETLLQLTKVESMMDSMYAGIEQMMRQGMKQAAAGKQLTPEQERALEKMPPKLMEALRADFNWATLKPQYVQIYKETFTDVEVNDLIKFYRTPSGQSLIDKMPVVMQKSMGVAQNQLQTFIPRIQKAIDEVLREGQAPK
jgi:uncharacterized protein